MTLFWLPKLVVEKMKALSLKAEENKVTEVEVFGISPDCFVWIAKLCEQPMEDHQTLINISNFWSTILTVWKLDIKDVFSHLCDFWKCNSL